MSPVAFITGGSRGIGAAMVRRFKEAGYRVATCARSGAPSSLADSAFTCDVSNVDQVKAAISRVLSELGRLDALINNAGIAGENPLEPDRDDAMWHRILDVNLTGTFLVCKYGLPHLPDGSGRIVNIASVLGLRGAPDQVAYTAAKHGVIGLTRALAGYAAPRRITVNAVCPGWTRTSMAEGRMKELRATEAELAAGVPLGRFIEPEEVAGLALYLCGPGAAGITGQALTIDGGSLL